MRSNTINQFRFPSDFGTDFDVDAFDDAIANKGVPLIHWRAISCPVGLSNKYDYRRPHEDHEGCSNGFIYTRAGMVDSLFVGNSTQLISVDVGLLYGSSVQVTFPRYYYPERDGVAPKPFLVAPFDRFYLPDESILVVGTQTFEASGRPVDKLRFPVVEVIDLVDSNGIRYQHGADFVIEDGRIRWIGTNRPSYDAVGKQGQVCSVRYTYRPYWLFRQHIHELRVSQAEAFDGNRALIRMPQAGLLQRENVSESEDADPDAPQPNSPRQAKRPASSGLGPR